jgi:SAM-dependent methyltransferase
MRILDATCGKRGIWFDKKCPLATYIDIRAEVEPDMVMDCTKTSFADKTFDLIVFDPPHMVCGPKSDMAQRYGHFLTADILRLIEEAFIEFHRILKDEGFVLFKWNDHDITLERILTLIHPPFAPLFGQKTAHRTKHSSATYWMCLVKADLLEGR